MIQNILDMKILIVDDNYDFRSTLIEYFKSKGYNVFGAENGQKALRLIEENYYDIVLLDLNMPIMDGMETMAEIQEKAGDTHIIIVTGKEKPEKYYYYKNGCILFEKKPIDIVELELKVKNLLQALKRRNKNSIPDDTIIELDINSIYNFILDNIDDYNLNVDMIAEELGINKKQLYARVGEALTISVHEMIKNLRLLKAHELMNKGKVSTIKELSISIGYRDAGYFTKLFNQAMDIDLNTEMSNRTRRLKIKY